MVASWRSTRGCAGADEIDATGQLVVPGFVDVHTHYDAQALWDPELSPSGWQGVTSVVAGNCGFSFAPAREAGRDLLLRTLETVEDMRLATMQAGIEWDFETYPEYLARRRPATSRRSTSAATSATPRYASTSWATMRRSVRATDSEIDAMRAVVADALRGGALGFSTDRAGFIAGADGRPVPSMVASQDEVEALMRVTAEVGRGIVHIAPGDDYDWLYDFQRTLGRRVNWSCDPRLSGGVDDARVVSPEAGRPRRRPSTRCRRLGAGDVPPDHANW